ncbi:MAG: hypothetical protein IT372_27085 [Polyangiaceae bacterium]|nr:hypothetical protein [Polyangiaceae bacterium]
MDAHAVAANRLHRTFYDEGDGSGDGGGCSGLRRCGENPDVLGLDGAAGCLCTLYLDGCAHNRLAVGGGAARIDGEAIDSECGSVVMLNDADNLN